MISSSETQTEELLEATFEDKEEAASRPKLLKYCIAMSIFSCLLGKKIDVFTRRVAIDVQRLLGSH